MANRMKEDEKNEKIIRGLLKRPENRRCINCNSLGPQYVCTNFWTFVCTTCSGIHREFTHRVKSVSMAKFTSQEVSALQGGGNQCAKEIYFKEWDPQRHSIPDSSNIERLRDFIKHVYVDRRYSGEKNIDRPPRVKMVDREDSYTYRSGSRSPVYEDIPERPYGEGQKYGDYKRSPARFEVVDDRLRDDRLGNRRFEDNRSSDGEAKPEGRSPSHRRELYPSSPPVVHPVQDILGEDVPPLRVGEHPKAYGGRASDGSAQTQRSVSSSSLGSVERTSAALKRANSGSLIDFSAHPKPPEVAAAPQVPQTSSTGLSIAEPATSSINDGNWAFFDSPTQDKVSQIPSSAKTLDSVMSQLLVPAVAPVGDVSMLHVGGVPATAPVSNISVLTPGSGAMGPAAASSGTATLFPISGGDTFTKVNNVGQFPSIRQPQHSLFPNADSQSTAPQFIASVSGGLNNEFWSSSSASNAQGSLSTPTLQSSQGVPELIHNTVSEVISQSQTLEAKSMGRKELPEDLFTATYASVPIAVPGWQAVPPRGMGYGMQYPTAMHLPAFPQSSKSSNPFDLINEPTLVQVPTFPSMAPLQGALPNLPAQRVLLRTSSLGSPSPQWIPPQSLAYAAAMPSQPSAYPLRMPSQPSSYPLGIPPSAYMGQQIPGNLPSFGHQGVRGFGSDGAVFGTVNANQQLGSGFSAPATPNSFSSIGGNPFG